MRSLAMKASRIRTIVVEEITFDQRKSMSVALAGVVLVSAVRHNGFSAANFQPSTHNSLAALSKIKRIFTWNGGDPRPTPNLLLLRNQFSSHNIPLPPGQYE